MKQWMQRSLAALGLTLAFSLAASAGDMHTAKLKIKSVDAAKNRMVLSDNENKDWTYTLHEDAKIYRQKGQEGKLQDLKEGTQIHVLGAKRGDDYVAFAVLVPEGTYKNAGLSFGTLKMANPRQVVITDSKGKDWTYQIAKTAQVEIDGKPAKLGELKQGAKVAFAYDKQGDQYTVLDLCSKSDKDDADKKEEKKEDSK